MSTLDLGGMFLLGLGGSVHCVGMCGGFVMCLSGSGGRRQAAWQVGRGTAYAALGALLAVLGMGARATWDQAGGRGALFLAALVMVLVGLGFLGVLPRFEPLARFNPLRGVLGRLLVKETTGAAFSLGLLTGLLPCGLLYAAFARAAAAAHPLEGALLMLAFWLGSSPGLAAVASLAPFLRRVGPQWWPRIAGATTLALGLMLAWKGLHPPAAAGHCPNCH